jgi:hypothetical protein
MGVQTNYVKADAMPAQVIKPLATGATSPMQSAQFQQQQQIKQQMELIGKTGGSKRRKMFGGSNARILVPTVQPGVPNSQQTAAQYTDLTALASKQASEAKYDGGNTATVAATQKGGYPNWGCLSGGRQYRNKRKTRKTIKSRKTKKHNKKRNTRNKRR